MNKLNPKSWVHPALFASIPAGLVLLDDTGVVADINPVAERMFGQNIIGHCWDSMTRAQFITRAIDGSGLMLRSGAPLQVKTCLLPENAGQLVMMHEIIASDEQEFDLSVPSKNQNPGQVLSSLVQELRNPLTTAMLLTDRLQESSGSREAATRLQAQLSRIEGKVNDVLLLTKGGQILHDCVNAGSLYESWKNDVRLNREWKGISFFWSCEPDVTALRLKCNLVALRSAIYNLIGNACEADARRVLIDFRRKAGNLIVCVVDDGAGMVQEVLPMATQIELSTCSTGSGLGLPLVETIAQAHMGSLEVTSRQDEGTRASLILPLDVLQQPQSFKTERGC